MNGNKNEAMGPPKGYVPLKERIARKRKAEKLKMKKVHPSANESIGPPKGYKPKGLKASY